MFDAWAGEEADWWNERKEEGEENEVDGGMDLSIKKRAGRGVGEGNNDSGAGGECLIACS